jgi:hypothetical protein
LLHWLNRQTVDRPALETVRCFGFWARAIRWLMFVSDVTQISVFMVILACRRTRFLNARAEFGRVFQSFDDLPRVAEGLGMIVIAAPPLASHYLISLL